MEDKRVLGQFHAKISKAKILFDTTSATNQKLRRQANQLQREYENLKNKRIQTEQWEKDADNRMNNMRNMHKEENDRCRRETKELDDLRANRKEFQRVKKICQSDLQTKTLQLQELVRRREQLQATAKSLTQKLQSTVAQKNVLQQQYIKTNKAIQKYDQNIKALTEEIQYARQVITTNTVPVHNVHFEQHSNSREKNGRP